MNNLKDSLKILVISANAELAETTRRAVGDASRVEYAANEIEGRVKVVEFRPGIIILGFLDPPGGVLKLYRDLREGWISRHASLLVVELDTEKDACRVFDNANLTVSLGEYTFLAGETSPLLPAGDFLNILKEAILKKLAERRNKLRAAMLDPDSFCMVWEQIPGPGAFEVRQEMVLENARLAAQSGKICAVSITDNPGGNPAIATDVLCSEIRKAGIEPLVHISLRDKGRNQMESLLFQLAALDIKNILILTGDYPSNLGFQGRSKPVFDLDAINGLRLVAEMNRGLQRDSGAKPPRLTPTSFFAGSAFSPFKQRESEVIGQYVKMKKKIEAGANFVITQVGYDARKLHEFQLWLKRAGYQMPALAAIYTLSYPMAKIMHDNRVPGCVVTDKLVQQIGRESESKDKGRQARLERAAKMYAIVKGLGYRGAYISGQGLTSTSIEYIIDKGQALSPNWRELVAEFDYPQEKGFYFFEKDLPSGLNSENIAVRREKPLRPPVYLLSRLLHVSLFEPKSPLFAPTRGMMRIIHSSNILEKPFHSFELWTKTVLYGCKDCGDCALFDVAYLCPVSQCPKDQRNAPCGGSFEGWCEVYPGKKQCIWVRAYGRLKGRHAEDSLGEFLVPPCDWELWQTSSWVNYFLGRDHVSKRTQNQITSKYLKSQT